MNNVECFKRKRKLCLFGCFYYKGRPASGAFVTVYQKFLNAISLSLVNTQTTQNGCFGVQANRYLLSKKNLFVKIKYFYQKEGWLNEISGSFQFPFEIAMTCINRDIAPDMGKIDLKQIPGYKKRIKVKRCIQRRRSSCSISFIDYFGILRKMIIEKFFIFFLIFMLNINEVECFVRKRKLCLLGCLKYKGKPASGAFVSVYQKIMRKISVSLVNIQTNQNGCFRVQASRYLLSKENIYVKIKYYYQEEKWLNEISGSFKFPLEIAVTCINRDIAPDMGTIDLTTIPRFKKKCKVRRCRKRRRSSCRISFIDYFGIVQTII
uniref:Carboxypeptidase regulatory-like domain-containing protein n=1 Tax=Strongyloides venezuelensis TaxID=75913 RepID=A0A0K0F1A0_STRVS